MAESGVFLNGFWSLAFVIGMYVGHVCLILSAKSYVFSGRLSVRQKVNDCSSKGKKDLSFKTSCFGSAISPVFHKESEKSLISLHCESEYAPRS
jgi:hypothetical protein